MVEISGQAATFLLISAAGFALGIFYDILRIFRKIVRHNAVFISIEDVIFWAVAAVGLFILLMQVNFGQLRFFVFLGVGAGLVLYFFTLSRPILRFGDVLKKGLLKSRKYAKMKFSNFREAVRSSAEKARKYHKKRRGQE